MQGWQAANSLSTEPSVYVHANKRKGAFTRVTREGLDEAHAVSTHQGPRDPVQGLQEESKAGVSVTSNPAHGDDGSLSIGLDPYHCGVSRLV